MKIETYPKKNFQILRISEGDDKISDLSELQDLITGYLDRGKYNIAVSFSDASYIYSGAIRVLIHCHKLITENGGELCIIEPNPSLFDVLEMLNIDRVIRIFVSEDYLPQE
ncbi:MAG: STAS domain-containing protein [Chitinivibrionales bacterium]|nr:STAS domain-containing protein [Chitinivibrionales bacterium]MBD3395485.1 STAS domain-containing protein [Chitinivibrionales bacterium]